MQQSLSQSGTAVANYTWLADGTKCAVADNTTNGYNYLGSLIYNRNGSTRTLESTDFGGGRIVYSGSTYSLYYYITDHLGSIRTITDNSGIVREQNDYYPFGGRHANGSIILPVNKQKFNGKELQTTGFLDYGARMYDDAIGRWSVVDPMAEKRQWVSSYNFVQNNPLAKIDLNGMLDEWVESKEKTIYWDKNATSQATTKEGEKYLGKNVLVGTHNRDKDLNEPINSAKFELYLESNTEGPSATIMGNTVPANPKEAGTLAEGLYKAESGHRNKEKYKDEKALRIFNIDGKDHLPTVNGNPNPNSDGITLTGVLLHIGNQYQESLTDSKNIPYSEGCQTSHNGPNAKNLHDAFFKIIGDNFKGNYYLKKK